ncbi:MAG: hypothetical protein AB3N16_01300 [Flavobacteriaceae bacterium]
MRIARSLLLLCLFSCRSVFAQVDAPAALIPAGLNPGDEFFVIFTTSGTANLCHGRPTPDTTGGAITPVDDTLAINLATTAASTGTLTSSITGWQALYIHERLDALGIITNTVAASGPAFNNNITQPIYNIAGNLVANNRSDLFDGNAVGGGTDLINTFDIDENGNVLPPANFAYTGFDAFGNMAADPGPPPNTTRPIGAGGTGCGVGDYDLTDQNWAYTGNSAVSRHLYVLSPLLRVPLTSSNATGVPVAPYGFVVMLGLLMIVGVGRQLKK